MNMKSKDNGKEIISIAVTNAPEPIQIFVSYEWDKEYKNGTKVPKPVRQQERWNRLRCLIEATVRNVETRAEKRPGPCSLQIRINRLRGRHGMALLSILRERILRADIVIIDIGSDEQNVANANTLLELGLAVSAGKSEQGSLFILKPNSLKWPSDLDGILYTEYKNPDSGKNIPELVDRVGFDAALRGRILELARERKMLGSPEKSSVEFEGDPVSD